MDLTESRKDDGEMEVQHISHQHPLFFIQHHDFASEEDKEAAGCSGCGKAVEAEGPSYGCNECKYYLHKECGELELAPQINHPFHPQHPLNLLTKSPRWGHCDFCRRRFSGFLYKCDDCDFDLHINCALLHLQSSSITAADFPNCLHPHPLLFVQNHNEEIKHDCTICEKPLSGPINNCLDCSLDSKYFSLHKECAELPLVIDHPFHPQHLLTLLPKPKPQSFGDSYRCNFCYRTSSGFGYHCVPCRFDLDINCALLQSSIAANFPNSLHHHPLLFIPNHNKEVFWNCSGCWKPFSGPIYHCSDCTYPDFFNLHKECAELPLEINHPYDRKHPLTILPQPTTHPKKCSCYLCKIEWRGIIYSCSLCKFELTPEDVSAPRTITNASHEHPWKLLSRQMSFICDFCGTAGDRTPYLCPTCDLLVHRNCISIPRKILITRHHHVISHSYPLRQNQPEDSICKICYEDIDTRYGCYFCLASNCGYIAHVQCATDKEIWDGTSFPEDYDEKSMEALLESTSLITDVFEQMSIEDQMVAIKIKHANHDHNLILTSSGEIEDDSQCDGCVMPITLPFYSCDQCKFFLHKDCAELTIEKRHPFHKHVLTLTISNTEKHGYSDCSACKRPYNGFSYKCFNGNCRFIEFDIGCILLSDTLKHPSHEHSLYLVHNFRAACSGCTLRVGYEYHCNIAYRCMKRCDFTVHIGCATLPLTTWYKNDRHPLTLTYVDDPCPSQHFCDLCENERDPKYWFYCCAECDNSLHSKCALGDPRFIKLGSKFKLARLSNPVTVVKNLWNCPPCYICHEICNGKTLECKGQRDFSIHWDCRSAFTELRTDEPFQ